MTLARRAPDTLARRVLFTQGQVRDSPVLGPEAATRFRSALGELMYLAQDRPDLEFAVVRAA